MGQLRRTALECGHHHLAGTDHQDFQVLKGGLHVFVLGFHVQADRLEYSVCPSTVSLVQPG